VADAYRVIVDSSPCGHCGLGGSWTVEGPDGVAIGESFDEEADADETAELLNAVHEIGVVTHESELVSALRDCIAALGGRASANVPQSALEVLKRSDAPVNTRSDDEVQGDLRAIREESGL
jgi:hypothetical protein